MLDLLLAPFMVISTLIGIGAAVLLHRYFPSTPVEVEAALVIIGFLVGLFFKTGEK